MDDAIYYFAYGSNLHPERLRRRTPSCEAVGVAELPGYALRFHKRGRPCGSGKCDAYFTGDPEDRVHGVVYRLDPRERRALDDCEGLGFGYEMRWTQLRCGPALYEVFFYVARPPHVDPGARPFSWYRDLVLHGARYHGLPAGYCARIADTGCSPDPDQRRHAEHQEILASLRPPPPQR